MADVASHGPAMDGAPGWLAQLSAGLGTSEPALRLLLSILLGYPLAFVHRHTLYGRPGAGQHAFFVASGLAIGYFNYGCDILHTVLAVFFTYLVTRWLRGSALSVAIVFVVTFSHLLLGYHYTGTEGYDITWTMPQCVLVLRLIGYAFDLYDGQQPPDSLGPDNRKVCLRSPPGLLEYCGFMFFPASILVGPQFPFRRYHSFVSGEFRDSDDGSQLPDCVGPGLTRLLIGLVYLGIFQVGSSYFTEAYLLSDQFDQLSFLRKLFYLGLWAKVQLYKYISCWLITEGALITIGISYNGKDKDNVTQWNGCENVKLSRFENTTEFNHYIQSFNINTNHWVAQYIYKRLKFLGNRYVSQFAALLFLAVWHGFHSGYYVCFAFEFLVMLFEKDLKAMVARNDSASEFFGRPLVRSALYVVLRLYTFVFMGWCLLPFVMLQFPRYWHMYSTVHYMGIVVFVPWAFLYKPLVRCILPKNEKKD